MHIHVHTHTHTHTHTHIYIKRKRLRERERERKLTNLNLQTKYITSKEKYLSFDIIKYHIKLERLTTLNKNAYKKIILISIFILIDFVCYVKQISQLRKHFFLLIQSNPE